jgi:hypothetical protein
MVKSKKKKNCQTNHPHQRQKKEREPQFNHHKHLPSELLSRIIEEELDIRTLFMMWNTCLTFRKCIESSKMIDECEECGALKLVDPKNPKNKICL